MSTPIPKCTLTDRELYDLVPPSHNLPFLAIPKSVFHDMRYAYDTYVQHMVDSGKLVPTTKPDHLFSQRNRND